MNTINKPTITAAQLITEFKLCSDSHDMWGEGMALRFDIAEYLEFYREATVPADWEFVPGIGSDCQFGYYMELLERMSTADIIYVGFWLKNLTDNEEALGNSY